MITTQGLSVSPACLVLDLVLVLASYNEATIATPHASSTKVPFSARRVECTLPLVSSAGLRGGMAASSSRHMAVAVGTRVAHAKRVLERADAVCFDVDSTVVTSEGTIWWWRRRHVVLGCCCSLGA